MSPGLGVSGDSSQGLHGFLVSFKVIATGQLPDQLVLPGRAQTAVSQEEWKSSPKMYPQVGSE